jgi:CDGSH-type Zn-finger protein
MADEPVVAQRSPYTLDMQPGTYWWCACGRSKQQPFCDGSHKPTSLRPVKVEIETARRVAWCGCKHSGDGAFCDGTHRKLGKGGE